MPQIRTTVKVTSRIPQATGGLMRAVAMGLADVGEVLISDIQTNYLSGPRPGKLGVGSGDLRSSITKQVGRTGSLMWVRVGPRGIPYARIHVFGGTILPKRKEYLKFKINGRWIMTKKVVIPARDYLRPPLEKGRTKFQMMIANRLAQFTGRK